MDNLLMSLTDSLVVSVIPNNPAAPHPRFSDYKVRNKKLDQEARRRLLLEEQKSRRLDLHNSLRGLANNLTDDEKVSRVESMESSDSEPRRDKKRHHGTKKCYKHNLMQSEWLVEVPENLSDDWILVPCPEGRRTTVAASEGSTTAWTKNGQHITTFPSALPGGHKGSSGTTVLDCIWSSVNKSYYVLDCIQWNNISLANCETEFRFFWLKSKFIETPDISVQSSTNPFPLNLLTCSSSSRTSLSNLLLTYPMYPDNNPRIDGLLFYHSRCHYTPGHTPLVGWLKPHMVFDVLGVTVAPEYNMPQMIQETKPKIRKKSKKHVIVGMELEESCEME